LQSKHSKGKEEPLNVTTTEPHNCTPPGTKNEMSHGKPI